MSFERDPQEQGLPPSGPGKPEKTIAEHISGFKHDFEQWLQENPALAQQLKQELLSMAGLEEGELTRFNLDFLKIPASELTVFGTVCGKVGNKAFTKEVVDFLQSKGVGFILGLGDNLEPKISSAVINMSGRDARKFSAMIDKNDGSLRADSSRVNGWSAFESE